MKGLFRCPPTQPAVTPDLVSAAPSSQPPLPPRTREPGSAELSTVLTGAGARCASAWWETAAQLPAEKEAENRPRRERSPVTRGSHGQAHGLGRAAGPRYLGPSSPAGGEKPQKSSRQGGTRLEPTLGVVSPVAARRALGKGLGHVAGVTELKWVEGSRGVPALLSQAGGGLPTASGLPAGVQQGARVPLVSEEDAAQARGHDAHPAGRDRRGHRHAHGHCRQHSQHHRCGRAQAGACSPPPRPPLAPPLSPPRHLSSHLSHR